jgi:hypothetical protein
MLRACRREYVLQDLSSLLSLFINQEATKTIPVNTSFSHDQNWLGASHGDTGFNGFLSVPSFQAGIAQVTVRFARRWMVSGSNPGGGKIFRTHPEKHEANQPPAKLVRRLLPGGKAAGAWR